jgi:hypothetical protein
MEEFHRELQGCYGQLRFRRTMRTPTAGGLAVAALAMEGRPSSLPSDDPPSTGKDAAAGDAASASTDGFTAGATAGPTATGVPTAIPLTKLKRALPGALPTHIAGAGSSTSARELVLDPEAAAPTTGVPELASSQRRPAQPILLTRRKPARAIGASSSPSSPSSLSSDPAAPWTAASAPLPGATPTEVSRADSSPGAIPVATPGESRKRTTLPLRPATLTADAPPTAGAGKSVSWTSAPPGRPPGTPPLPLWGTDLRGPTSPARTHPSTEPIAPAPHGSVPRSLAADRPTPRVELAPSPARADAAAAAAAGVSAPPPDLGAPPDEERPAWFDGPTVVRNPLSVASLRDLKPPSDS